MQFARTRPVLVAALAFPLAALSFVAAAPVRAAAAPVAVRSVEGVTRGFLLVSAVDGKPLGQSDIQQVADPGHVESRMIFRLRDGSIHDETVFFTQSKVFKLGRFKLGQTGPSFAEPNEISLDATTGEYLAALAARPGW